MSISQRLLIIGVIGVIFAGSIALGRDTVGASTGEIDHVAQLDTPTNTPLPPTSTNTALPPTPTNTPLPPTPTNTPVPPTATNSPPPPTATNTPTPINQSPSISAISNRTTNEDTPTGFIPFTIADPETPANQLSVSASSSNTILLPNASIRFGGSGGNRSIKLRPAANKTGSTTLTVTISDGLATAKSSFNLLVKPINDAPVIDLNGGDPGIDSTVDFVTNEDAIKFADGDLRVLDVDNTKLSSATVALLNPVNGPAEVLTANTAGTQITAVYSSGTLTLNGLDSKANYQKVLRSITYDNTAESPSPVARTIEVQLSDGLLNSSIAQSTISIIDPRLIVDKQPETQTIAQGGSAIFTIEIQNAGNTPLYEVTISDELSPDCEREIGTLSVGESLKYSCNHPNNYLEFTNIVVASGHDNLDHASVVQDSARVEVANPNIQVVKSPASQTTLQGEPARFDVFVINPSTTVDLINVAVVDPLVPDCSRTGIHQFNNLRAGQDIIYQCQLDDVTTAFTNVITATGTNLLTGQTVIDSSVANVELLDLSALLSATPSTLHTPGGLIDFSLTISNPGSVDVTLSSLSSVDYGLLLNPDNPQLISNNCSSQNLPSLAAGEQFSCTFSGMVEATPPFKEVAISIEARDNDQNSIVRRAATKIDISAPVISTAFLPLVVQSYIQPDEENDLPCTAYPISINRTYLFLPDDLDDWYYYDIEVPGIVKVRMQDFLPKDGQLAIWTGTNCDYLDTLVGHNANFLPTKEITYFALPDRYYVWVTNSDAVEYDQPYLLVVDTP